MSKLLVSLLCATGLLTAVAAPASAAPFPPPTLTPERFYIVDSTRPVDITLNFGSATTWNAVDLYVGVVSSTGGAIDWVRAFQTENPGKSTAGATLVGSNVFSLPVGTAASELAFKLVVKSEVDPFTKLPLTFYSGGGLGNPDGAWHTVSKSTGDVLTVGFEDTHYWGGSDWDYNDFVFSSKNLSLIPTAPAVPEPETYAMLLAGLALTGAVARRRSRGNV